MARHVRVRRLDLPVDPMVAVSSVVEIISLLGEF